MKKLFIVMMALALVAGFTGVSMAAIANSAHDFSGETWGGGQICLACHTPHNADLSVADSPLWNHEVTTTVFTLYTSPTLDAQDVGQPSGVSKLCLSCHDGTVALDSYSGNTGTIIIGGTEDLGTDMSDDHPISFTYDTGLSTTDGELRDPSTALSGTAGGSTIDVDMLFSQKMECSSCHDVHNGAGAVEELLVKSNANSALCLTCHNK